VVHAYDLNMQVPASPAPANDDDTMDVQSTTSSLTRPPTLRMEGTSVIFRRNKRQRTSDSLEERKPAAKHRHLRSPRSSPPRGVSPHTAALKHTVEESDGIIGHGERNGASRNGAVKPTPAVFEPETAMEMSEGEILVTPGLRHTKVRELLHLLINESLRVGGRPESAIAEDTDGGEIIEVRTRGANGDLNTKTIEWSVDPQVPETIFGKSVPTAQLGRSIDIHAVDERDLAKLVSCVFLNAVKFTEVGRIRLKASLTSRAKFIVINVDDTGPGIPAAFLPNLFKPFSREDDSTTRQKEGLGLGLLVAKGLARKIGGDLICVRSDTEGPRRGSEFELRVPLLGNDSSSRASTPTRTPTPATASQPKNDSRSRNTASVERRRTPRTQPKPTATEPPDPLGTSTPSRANSLSQPTDPTPSRRPSTKHSPSFDRNLAKKYPLTFLVAEDNKINRKLLVSMLGKLGYSGVHEAYDGAEAVHQMSIDRPSRGEKPIDVILMDLWMPNMDGYEATQRIFALDRARQIENDSEEVDPWARRKEKKGVTVLAVSADVTDDALEKASEVGMEGFMAKPYKLMDLERLILEYCAGGGALEQV